MPFLKTFMVLSLLTALGYLGNVASLPVAFSVSFLFGSIFVIIAVSLFGPLLGGLSALIASSYTYILWNHPYAIIIFVCEALWLGFFLKRKHTNIVLIDAAYWMVIGLPLVFIFYFGVMSLGFQSAAIIFLKQAINGIVNALIASIMISHLPLQKWFRLPSDRPPVPYSRMIFHLTSAFLMLPLIGMLLFTNHQESKTIQAVVGKLLVSESKTVNGIIHLWLERHEAAVKAIAELGGSHHFQPSEKLQAELLQTNSLFPDIHAVYIADPEATTIAFIPAVNERGEKTIGMNFAEREYFKQLKSTLKPVVSDVFKGRGGVFAPIFTISVPIVEDGKLLGFGLGALNLENMLNMLEQSTQRKNLMFTIVDRNQNIVCSTASQNSPLTQIKQKTGGQTLMLGKDIGLWTPNMKKNISIMNIWKDATYFVKLPIAGTTWTLLTEFPVAPLQGYLYHATIVNLLLVFCLFVVAIILSQILSKLLARTPLRLAAISRDIPEKLENNAELTWPDSNIWEMHLLISNFKETTQALSLQYQHIKEMNIQLEERVRERTAELQKSEMQYRTLFEAIADAVFLIDQETGSILDVNPAATRLYGFNREEFLRMTATDVSAEPEKTASAVRDPGPFIPLRYHRRKDGSVFPVEFTANSFESRGRTAIIAAARDITDRRQAEAKREKLEVLNRQLQKAESLGRMAGAIAHHFNNQLQAVMGYLELAMDGSSGNTALREDLTEAMQAAGRGAEVSRMMLVYLGQTTGKRAPMDLSEACGSGLRLLQAVMPKNILMETDLPAPGPAIRANANQIQQVLTNLITNAWESMPEDGGAIRLTVKTVSAEEIPKAHRFPIDWRPRDESYACLEVADPGCGIEEQDLEKLFDPFFSTKFTGRGLGLPVVVGIAGAHGGLVTVESHVGGQRTEGGGRRTEGGGQGSEGSGSVFRVFFPLTVEEVIRQPEKPKEISAVAGNGTALVIDDEPQVRELAARMLLKLGFTVLEAGDGVEGVEMFKAHPGEIRCVICDLSMPRMDGWETLSALRKLSPGISVILASGYDEASVMTGDHPEWPQAFLGKPYGFQDLRDAIGRAVPKEAENRPSRG